MCASTQHERTGKVVVSHGAWYEVDLGEAGRVRARIRGRFRIGDRTEIHPVVVGDEVRVRLEPDGTGLILERLPRRNQLVRRAAGGQNLAQVLVANVDLAICVQSVHQPRFNPGFLDRFLVAAESYGIPGALCVNKIDLAQKRDWRWLEPLLRVYAALGYPVVRTSAHTGEGLAELRALLSGRVCVFSGPSGVGKSSLLNALQPGLKLRVGEVSPATEKGRHTTTFVALYRLDLGGYVVDTPGLREFGLWNISPEELGHYFPEMRSLLGACRFHNCTHAHEPGCAVREAVARGAIAPWRYESYLAMLATLEEAES
ncbi:MAG: ribosome small subunit-dependent GTPase A [Bacteroidota bacterium]|nr:ribosome small subunit-dependent GTPase A [Bacteroidota bacterium]MDW8137537.1 ribosome small subunit-dependent GTPase A [Bacteroidota bacterium]